MHRAVLTFGVRASGDLEIRSPWFPHVEIHPSVLDRVDGMRVRVDGDVLAFHCANGGARYLLGDPSTDGVRTGTLLRSWAC